MQLRVKLIPALFVGLTMNCTFLAAYEAFLTFFWWFVLLFQKIFPISMNEPNIEKKNECIGSTHSSQYESASSHFETFGQKMFDSFDVFFLHYSISSLVFLFPFVDFQFIVVCTGAKHHWDNSCKKKQKKKYSEQINCKNNCRTKSNWSYVLLVCFFFRLLHSLEILYSQRYKVIRTNIWLNIRLYEIELFRW